ncbi:MAG: tRNA (adenosine(37)-N6)-threonylcarbamoyltransferase complex dimerization subunit type 1 TsaB [Deltaproteobacteria bacterium]|nr:tRNA (adenosine(37)-N6)-threonylcarbamoyltransferase complex dimerization subunit type 1 TsaB [Deltaproteobacteria bacterium]
MTTLLALDTSSPRAGMALLKEGHYFDQVQWGPLNGHTQDLAKHYLDFLNLHQLTPSDIDAYAVTVGPGSFTGLRVGLSFVKGLALLQKNPVIGVSALATLASAANQVSTFICPMIDARRDEVYSALYQWREGSLHLVLEEGAYAPNVWAEKVREISKSSLTIFGTGFRKYSSLFQKEELSYQELPNGFDEISPRILAELAWSKFLKQDYFLGGIDLFPHYLRASEAELKAQGFGK